MGHEISHMGHKVSHLLHLHHHTDHVKKKESIEDERILVAFNTATKGAERLTYHHIQELFPDDLVRCIWPFVSGGKPTNTTLSFHDFSRNVIQLLDFPLAVYIELFQPTDTFISVCARAAGVDMQQDDTLFLKKLKENLADHGDTPDALFRWNIEICAHIARSLHSLICHRFLGETQLTFHLLSRILSQAQMWFLQTCLPYTYCLKEKGEDNQWTLLHSTILYGRSVQAFTTNVFGYSGHSVMIVKLTDGRTIAVATECTWNEGSIPFGGRETAYFELDPDIKRTYAADMIYCNFKPNARHCGITVNDVLSIDCDLSQVCEMEVWGCSGRTPQQHTTDQKSTCTVMERLTQTTEKEPVPDVWRDSQEKDLLQTTTMHF